MQKPSWSPVQVASHDKLVSERFILRDNYKVKGYNVQGALPWDHFILFSTDFRPVTWNLKALFPTVSSLSFRR